MEFEELALVYSSMEKYGEAIELSLKALNRRKESLGEDDYDVLQSKFLLAWTYSVSGQYQKAQEIYGDLLRKFTLTLGEDPPDTLNTMIYMTEVYGYLGQLEKWILLVTRAIEVGSNTGRLDLHDLQHGRKCLALLKARSAKSSDTCSKRLTMSPPKMGKDRPVQLPQLPLANKDRSDKPRLKL